VDNEEIREEHRKVKERPDKIETTLNVFSGDYGRGMTRKKHPAQEKGKTCRDESDAERVK